MLRSSIRIKMLQRVEIRIVDWNAQSAGRVLIAIFSFALNISKKFEGLFTKLFF